MNASAKERRQMIEDALGLKIYQLRKIESERKLEKTEENISQIDALRKEIQPHLRFLKKQVDKAREEIFLKDELRKFYRRYFAAESGRIESEEKRISEEKKSPEEELKNIERNFSEDKNDSRADEIKKELIAMKEGLSKIEAEANESRANLNALERELGRSEGMIEIETNANR